MIKANYKTYTLENYLDDEDFVRWVLEAETESEFNSFFQDLHKTFPEQRKNISDAKKILNSLKQHIDKKKLSENTIDDLFKEFEEKKKGKEFRQRRRLLYYTTSIAASLLILITVYLLWISQNYFQEKEILYKTDFGKTKEVDLPDGSKITLNSNSVLRIRKTWNKEKAREVWLEGEAFFEVKKKPKNMNLKFLVHTTGLDVEVLGTTFNINSRSSSTDVLLTSGRIKVQNKYNDKDKSILETPGEMVTINSSEKKLLKQVVSVKPVISWRDNLLVFERTPITEIFNLLAENYGYKIQVRDSSALRQDFVGAYPANDIEVLLKSLEKIVELERDGKTIIIKGK